MFDWMVRVDDFIAAVERIATSLERIEAHTERIAQLYGNVVGSYRRDPLTPNTSTPRPWDANLPRSDNADSEAGA
jgi:hypothetical protein